ncbi:Oxysterol-binding protein OBPa [Cryptotrichosporon argae]
MGLLSHSMDTLSINKSRRQSNASGAGDEPDGREQDTSTLKEEEGHILTSIISQLRPGMDLSKIALPTFVLEPRSLLERITDFFSHPELIFGAGEIEDPKERFLRVMTFYLSGWHIKPKGVKKPYNPVLGEFFRCSYQYPDGSEGFYVAEQVSHHPPVSAFFYASPQNGLLITGELKPKSRFLGNSAATIMEGEDRIRLLNRPEDGDYSITMPNTYARGILFGKMILELGDISTIKNEKTDYKCDVEFKTKGWISGGYNVISGHVKGPGRAEVGEVSGMWSSTVEFAEKGSKKTVLFDAATARSAPKSVLPLAEQEEKESRRLWAKLTDAIKRSDQNAAQAAKSEVEEHQRELVRVREAKAESAPESRFFRPAAGDKWMPKLDVDNLPKDVAEAEEAVRKFIFGDKATPKPGAEPSGTPTSPDTAATAPSSAKQATPVSSPKQPKSAPAAGAGSGTGAASMRSVTSSDSLAEPPSVPTAPGPPAPGPKHTHPV